MRYNMVRQEVDISCILVTLQFCLFGLIWLLRSRNVKHIAFFYEFLS